MTGFNPYSIPAILTLGCFAALALLTAIRAPGSRVNRLFLMICIFGVALNLDILYAFHSPSASAALRVSRVDHFFLVFSLPVYIQFFHAYLNISRRKWLERCAYVLAAAMAAITPTPLYIASMERHFFGYFARGGMLYPLFGIGGLAVTIYVLVLLYREIKTAVDPARKNRLLYLLTGFAAMGALNGLNVLPVFGYGIYPPGNLSFIPLTVFAVGLFRHDLLDMGFLLEKGLLYSAVSALLTAAFALLLVSVHTLVQVDAAGALGFSTLLFFTAALVIAPLQNRIQKGLDRRFFPGRADFRRTLKSVSRKIVAVLDADRICARIGAVLERELLAECWALCDRDPVSGLFALGVGAKSDHPMRRPDPAALSVLERRATRSKDPVLRSPAPETTGKEKSTELQRAMEGLGAEIALPLPFGSRRAGLLLLGKKKSGRLYSPEEVDLLETLAGQTALALENARSCRQLRDLNRELERKVADKTRSLRAALAEKERTIDQLIRSESLAALGQLVAGVAHEMNNPLSSAKSLVQSVAEDLAVAGACDPEGELAEDLRFVDRELTRAGDIVASLLGLSRQTQTYTELVDLNAVIQDALRLLYNQYKNRNIAFVEQLAPDLPPVRGNFSNLGQVALNIVKNAVQAVGTGPGQIRLATRHRQSTGKVVFECADTGPGVGADIAGSIFKPFFTTKPPGQGTGLGLYLCHEIIARHGGELSLARGDGQGACFSVRLPAACTEIDEPEKK